VTPEFWHQRWQCGETGWHSADINRHLADCWPGLGVAAGARVLVPLCGKSLDMLWLAGRGYRVLGVELSPIAVEAFFRENGLEPRVTDLAPLPFVRWAVDEIELLVGDFFDLTADLLRGTAGSGIGAVYDRAALIALPPALRGAYAQRLAALLRDTGDPVTPPISLLISLDYDQARMQGPPFAVTEAEVRRLFDTDFAIDPLADFDALAENPRFGQRGLDRLREHVYELRLRPQRPPSTGF
jgi:thiopurine S-methyltransferase